MKKNRLLNRKLLLASKKNGIAPIETLKQVPIYERWDYALSVCTNATKTYPEPYHLGARNFIKKTLDIEDGELEELISRYTAYNQIKDKPVFTSPVKLVRFTRFDDLEFNQDLALLHRFITEYNKTDSFFHKKLTLIQIYQLQKIMEKKYQDKDTNTTEEYQTHIQQTLPRELRAHFALFQMTWPSSTAERHESQQSIAVEQKSHLAPINAPNQVRLHPLNLSFQSTGNRFENQFRQDMRQLNQLIRQYNAAHDNAEQIKILHKIREVKKTIEDKYPGDFIEKTPEYRTQIQEKLTDELRTQYAHLNIAWSNNPAGSFAAILDAMPSNKVTQLMDTLLNLRELTSLYQEHEPGYQEFQDFLSKHDITYLGGYNSKNFKITPNDGSPSYVLKIDNRMGTPKTAEAHLRAQPTLQQVFTPVNAERPACVTIGNVPRSRAVIITELCDGSDIETDLNTAKEPNQRVTDAIHIYSQMAEILKHIEAAGCAFPDMKNSNWLLNSEKTIRLADTKSFLFTTNGNVDQRRYQEAGFICISTCYVSPPEYSSYAPFSAEKAHAFLLGKNLYHYLTKSNWRYLDGKTSHSELLFPPEIFDNTLEGKKLKGLIQKLIMPDAHERITTTQALTELKEIQREHQARLAAPLETSKKDCQQRLASIMTYTNYNHASNPQAQAQIEQIKNDYETKINTATTTDELDTLYRELFEIQLEEREAFLDRIKPEYFDILDKIKTLPDITQSYIEEKTKQINSATPEELIATINEMNALYLSQKNTHKTSTSGINEEKSLRSYQSFKQALSDMRSDPPSVDENKPQNH